MTARLKRLNRLLPLVAIGTVADCQSILEPTNRLITKVGLQVMNQNTHHLEGLSELNKQLALTAKMQMGYRISSKDLGFLYSPIFNSSGRLSHASLSISVLVLHNGIDLQNHHSFENFDLPTQVAKLITTNQNRKDYVREITLELEDIARNQVESGAQVIWLTGGWSKGVVGLLASRLVNLFDLPVVVVSQHEDEYSASLRAPVGYNFPKAFEKVKGYMTKGGGHPQAAGFSATKSQIGKLQELLPQAILDTADFDQSDNFLPTLPPEDQSNIPPKVLGYITKVDSLLVSQEELVSQFLSEIFALEPFSQDFPSPKIITQIRLDDYRVFGNQSQHLKINHNDIAITCFNLDESITLMKGQQVWCKLEVSQNSWNGKTSLELVGEVVAV